MRNLRIGSTAAFALLLCTASLLPGDAARAGDEAPPASPPAAKAEAVKPGKTGETATTLTAATEPAVRVRLPRNKADALHLLDLRVVNVEFEDQRVADVARWLTTVTGVNVIVGPALLRQGDLDTLRVDLRLKKVSALTVLRMTAESLGLGIGYRNGVLLLTTVAEARGKPVLKLYTVADLVMPIRDFPGPDLELKPAGAEIEPPTDTERPAPWGDADSILDLVRDNVGGESWDDDGVSASTMNDWLVIKQYPEVHQRIADLLARLRSAR